MRQIGRYATTKPGAVLKRGQIDLLLTATAPTLPDPNRVIARGGGLGIASGTTRSFVTPSVRVLTNPR